MTDLIPAGLTAADESYHPPGRATGGASRGTTTSPRSDATLGGYVRLGLYPNQTVAWYWACVVGEGRRLVTVVDHDVRPPRPPSLEVRAEGLWADHNIETPFDHISLGCEAFALGLDDPAAMYDPHGPPVGDRVAFGLDLEWETDGAAYVYPPGTTRYEVPCRVHGEVLVGDERIELDAIGERDHSWGTRDWWTLGWTWSAGWLDDGTRFHGTTVRLGDDVVPYHPGFVQPPGGTAGGRRAHRGDLGARRPRVPGVGHRRLRRPPPRRRAGGVRPRPPGGRRRQGVALPAGAVPVPRRRHRADGGRLGRVEPAAVAQPPGPYR